MSIIFTIHAKKRMIERGISRNDVEKCITNPSRIFVESEKMRYFQKSFSDDTLEVVAETRGRHYIIITAYFL
ncbi:MAG: hypothetical protein A2934_02130 [Candidatus Sungbacteria bacterium RIFCSPLOWO2_01_FULL_47_10]|uniref:DUF4258 domain-containing protein n=1 Tax=Candidatus Sungbacteria bacterium RIFCSPLOWO2_01_FULL_47_10 TaxID=1802276 RepID=A0A1G2KYI8_9BACT|nr:MAG: hypothetical protein A2934_02130 [Candidatus Sungbacteria bacterium RIFCSPLOWO2_01_FULL_47_10]